MNALQLLPVILSCLLLGAHYLRWGAFGLVALWVSLPLLLLIRRRWVSVVFPAFLLGGAAVWVQTALAGRHLRLVQGAPWLRLVLILAAVAAFTAASALVFRGPRPGKRFRVREEAPGPGLYAFIVTFALLAVVQVKVRPAAILLERFVPGGGWLEATWLAVYAASFAHVVMDPAKSIKWRPRLWGLFSIVFFAQLGLGLAGVDRFLMTGRLHLPVPALIAAGPVYRGGGYFMLILFGATVLLAGPAWCSWLCYIGAWDDRASRLADKVGELPGWRRYLRMATLVLVLAAALILRRAGVPGVVAAWLAAGFGLIGIGVMVLWSRRAGVMAHCTSYCPIGFLATRFGKLNPFRIRIDEGCSECMACSRVCRYDALHERDVRRRRPGESCTLCGDCAGRCKGGHIGYRFPGLSPFAARSAFIVLVVSLHAVFLGLARI